MRPQHPAAQQGKTVGPTELSYHSCWPTTFYGLMLTATEGPQVAFLRATDPSTGRQRRTPRDGVILLGWRTADCDSGHVYCCWREQL